MIRVLVTDDHPVVREGVAAILSADPDIEVVAEADSGEEALRRAAATRPDVALLDLRLPGMNGIQACTALQERQPSVRVLMLSAYANQAAMLEAFSAGARGFLLKESGPAVLREAVRQVSDGATYVDPRVASSLVALASGQQEHEVSHGLTAQEMRILELLPRGLTNRHIGERLGISEATVKSHLYRLMRKLHVANRTEAAAVAHREGIA